MAFASLGLRTDLMLLALQGSRIEARGAFTVVRTPENPTYWWGNCVVAPDPSALSEARAVFAAEHPGAEHVAIAVDGTDGAPGLEDAATDLEVERVPVYSAHELHPPPRANADARLTRFDDWHALARFHAEVHPDEGEDFRRRRIASWRALHEAGHGHWYGALLDGELASTLGVFTDGGGVARFQAVDTLERYRRRGLAGALVHFAGTDALSRPDVDTLVIGADTTHGADRVYRSVGFSGDEIQVQLTRRPAAARAPAGPA